MDRRKNFEYICEKLVAKNMLVCVWPSVSTHSTVLRAKGSLPRTLQKQIIPLLSFFFLTKVILLSFVY